MTVKMQFKTSAAALAVIPFIGAAAGTVPAADKNITVEPIPGAKPRNVIFILSDDHRYDYMGFLGTVPWLQTPNMDFMARNGAYVKNAFVTTSLSSPSRASILTGLYSHEHKVVDNSAPMPDDLVFFPQYLQKAGYTTAFFGKWHMGEDEGAPRQPGFDHWESFEGQGDYYGASLNVNGEWKKYGDEVYTTDLLTDHAIDFIDANRERPFFVYLSHKAVHDPFQASEKHKGIYSGEQVVYPPSYDTPRYGIPHLPSSCGGEPKANRDWYGEARMPDWVKNQRESWHGTDYSYHGRSSFEAESLKYCESLTSLDESIGHLFAYLKANGLSESTLVIYMGDNGFCWGEHGLIDKRTFYEASVRIPMLAYCPEVIKPGTVVEPMVQNVDIGPSVMEACGIRKAPQMRGYSMLPLLSGFSPDEWRARIFYEYYWEYDFPQTPTTFGVRTDRYKLILYHGIWDTNEFYDLISDPFEMNNLIDAPQHRDLIRTLSSDVYTWLEDTGGMEIPLKRTVRPHRDHRNQDVY